MNVKTINDLYDRRQAEELVEVVLFDDEQSAAGQITLTEPPTGFVEYSIVTSIGGIRILQPQDSLVGTRLVGQLTTVAGERSAWFTGGSEVSNLISLNVGSSWQVGNDKLLRIVGHKKKHATTNLSKTLNVNDGADITAGGRYEILASELPSNFLKDDGSFKDNVEVKALIFNNSGTGVAKWGVSGHWTRQTTGGSNQASFVKAGTLGNVIVIQAGITALCANSVLSGSPFGNTVDITSSPCKVVATLSGEAYTVQTA